MGIYEHKFFLLSWASMCIEVWSDRIDYWYILSTMLNNLEFNGAYVLLFYVLLYDKSLKRCEMQTKTMGSASFRKDCF